MKCEACGKSLYTINSEEPGICLECDWREEPPELDGSFYYSGKTPDGGDDIIAIVQIFTDMEKRRRWACIFIPPFWRGNKARALPTLHSAALDKWPGKWSGAPRGLCCVEVWEDDG